MRVTVIFVGAEVGHWRSYCRQRPGVLNQSEDFGASSSIEVREVHLLIQRPGFRPTEIIWSPL